MLSFSRQEIIDITVAVVFLTVIFSFNPLPNAGLNLSLVLPSFIIVVTAFLFHEMAHKYMGIRYGCEAYFKLWPQGLFLGIITMFLPFRFVAPGATVVNPYRHRRWMFGQSRLTMYELGMISMAGPMLNIAFAFLFLPFAASQLFWYVSFINAYLALFNLLPIPPLDGSKVIIWKGWLWLIMIIVSGGLVAYLSGALASVI